MVLKYWYFYHCSFDFIILLGWSFFVSSFPFQFLYDRKAGMFKEQFFLRYELPLVRLSSFAPLVKNQFPPLVIIALANKIYFTERSGARLLCCLCETATDLHELLARSSLATSLLASSATLTSFLQGASLLEAEQTVLHRAGCPGFRETFAAQADNLAGMLHSSFIALMILVDKTPSSWKIKFTFRFCFDSTVYRDEILIFDALCVLRLFNAFCYLGLSSISFNSHYINYCNYQY